MKLFQEILLRNLGKVDQIYLKVLKCVVWRRMEISWINRVRNKGVLQTVNEDRNIQQTIKLRKANWTGHILLKTAF
jgi:hypothetical protein